MKLCVYDTFSLVLLLDLEIFGLKRNSEAHFKSKKIMLVKKVPFCCKTYHFKVNRRF